MEVTTRDKSHRTIDRYHNVWFYEEDQIWRLVTWHESLKGWRTTITYLHDQPHYTSTFLADRWQSLDFNPTVCGADFIS